MGATRIPTPVDEPADRPATSVRPLKQAFPPGLIDRLVERVVTGSSPTTVMTYAPFTGEELAALPQSMPGDIQVAFEAARKVHQEWAATGISQRAAVFRRFHDLLLQRQRQILDIIQIESGKARAHAFEEVAEIAAVARYYARTGRTHLRPRRRRGAYPLLTTVWEQRQPKGVIGIITPWNSVLTPTISDVIPALLAGNAVVLKPDISTALSVLWTHELLSRAGLPKGLFQIVVGDGPVIGPALIDHADYVAFTGSTRTGRQVAQQAAYRLIGCALDLGAKNSMLILDDADLTRAAECAERACFASAGQSRTSIERIFVHYSVYNAFMARFLDRVRAITLGAGLDFTADMGSLASAVRLDRVVAHVEDARAKGATVLAGGRARSDIGPFFYEPTVLTGVRPNMIIDAEETLGPAVAVHQFRSETEAISRANDTAYGLNASVWTRDVKRGREIATQLRVGSVNLNEGYTASWASVDASIGGRGDSGFSRRHGAEGILAFTDQQTVAVQRLAGFIPPFRRNNQQWAKTLTWYLAAKRWLRMR